MKINRQNYEVFLIDYLDGKLNPSQAAVIMAFLEKNPDIQDEFYGLKEAVLVDETNVFPNKSDLKKNAFLKNGIENEFDYLSIASIEGDITLEEKQKLNSIIRKDDYKARELSAFKKTTMFPDRKITYAQKDHLKRLTVIPIRLSSYRIAIGFAASFAILLAVYSIYKMTNYSKSLQNISSNNTQIDIHSTKEVVAKEIQAERKPTESLAEPRTKKIETIETIKMEEVQNKAELVDKKILEVIPKSLDLIGSKYIISNERNKNEFIAAAAIYPYGQQNNLLSDNSIKLGYYNKYNTREIGFFEIVQYGVKSFGRLIGREVKFEADKDKNGNIKKINFESSLIAFSAPIGKKE